MDTTVQQDKAGGTKNEGKDTESGDRKEREKKIKL